MAPKLSKMAMKSAMKSVMKKAPSGKLAATSQAGKNKIPDDWGFGIFQDENGETYVKPIPEEYENLWIFAATQAGVKVPKTGCLKSAEGKGILAKVSGTELSLKEKMDLLSASLSRTPGAAANAVAVEAMMTNLTVNDQQIVWKDFEAKRLAQGTQQQYAEATSGAGSRQKKRLLLTAYFEGAKNTKTRYFIKCAADVSHERTDKYEAAWLPLASMLTKYGKAELIDHVKEGSISCRPHPKNKKFWQFQDEVESTGTEVKNKRSFGTVSDTDTNKDAFLKFAKGDTKCLGSDLEGWSLEDLNDANDGSDAAGSVFTALGLDKRGAKGKQLGIETDTQKLLQDIDNKSIILKDDNEEKVLKKNENYERFAVRVERQGALEVSGRDRQKKEELPQALDREADHGGRFFGPGSHGHQCSESQGCAFVCSHGHEGSGERWHLSDFGGQPGHDSHCVCIYVYIYIVILDKQVAKRKGRRDTKRKIT